MPRFQPEEIFRRLNEHEVRYVLIGGLAATLHGSPLRTGDADICPATDMENLARLAEALVEIEARLRVKDAPGGLPFPCDTVFLSRVQVLNLITVHGDLDLSFRPSGTEGYQDLVMNASNFDLGGLVVPVADLRDVIRSKEAANRQKDRLALPTLRALLEAIENPTGSDQE